MIDQSIKSGMRPGFVLLFIDLDGFKAINDGYGHIIGDEILRQAAQRLRRAVCDTAVVARSGGDEFIILHAGSEPAAANKLAEAILTSFKLPFEIPGGTEALSVSVGVAVYPRDGKDGDALLQAADRALYRVKRAGGGAALAA